MVIAIPWDHTKGYTYTLFSIGPSSETEIPTRAEVYISTSNPAIFIHQIMASLNFYYDRESRRRPTSQRTCSLRTERLG